MEKAWCQSMSGKKKQVKDHQMILQVWGENPTHSMSIVKDNFKYLFWFYGGEGMTPKEELYNLEKDRYEMNNLADNKKYAKVLNEMRAIYDMEVANWEKILQVETDMKNIPLFLIEVSIGKIKST